MDKKPVHTVSSVQFHADLAFVYHSPRLCSSSEQPMCIFSNESLRLHMMVHSDIPLKVFLKLLFKNI